MWVSNVPKYIFIFIYNRLLYYIVLECNWLMNEMNNSTGTVPSSASLEENVMTFLRGFGRNIGKLLLRRPQNNEWSAAVDHRPNQDHTGEQHVLYTMLSKVIESS